MDKIKITKAELNDIYEITDNVSSESLRPTNEDLEKNFDMEIEEVISKGEKKALQEFNDE